jgi:hypothetical protein
MSHVHEPRGTEIVLERREADDYTRVQVTCLCGTTLTRETAPQGARYNWEEWRLTALGDPCLSCGGYNTPSCCEAEE